jgi:hypothetical protein
MPALTFEVATAKLSFSYDGLTIYPTMVASSYSMQLVMTRCFQLAFVRVPDEDPTIQKSCAAITQKSFFDRAIYRDDNDHFLYHQRDEYDMDDSHYHLKFRRSLSQSEVVILADVFEQEKLFSPQECTQFKKTVEDRCKAAHAALDVCLNQNKSHDLRAINQFVLTCADNDLLADLHQYLLSAKFNYLRACDGFFTKKSKWQGTISDGSIVETSKTWAMIEKAITLQLAANIRNNTKASAGVLLARAVEFSAALPFFSIPRRQGDLAVSRTYDAICNDDKDGFETRYARHFSTYTR